MTFLHNDPAAFAREAIEGLAAAYPDHLIPVVGGVVRASASPRGEVSVVLGGGSGHYPAFAGWVGSGFAHGAACGNIFASPPATHVASVARAAEQGGGIVLGFGNYAGDVLHFGQAAQILRAEGHDVRVVAVADDVASAPADKARTRRGVAGDLVVFKCLAAAAADGMDLDAVEAVGLRADRHTRSFGAAFTGCTLPGAADPLFTVAEGRMGLGLGIHGEPGLGETDVLSADDVADLLVDQVMAELVATAGDRVAVLVNGLGSTTQEELLVVYRRVAARLTGSGLTIVAPEVGELVTSLDMAGVSLTVTLLDEELERLWLAPADTPAFRRRLPGRVPRRELHEGVHREAQRPPGSPASTEAARVLARVLTEVRGAMNVAADRLGALDAVAGDGDHGIGMKCGTAAAATRAHEVAVGGSGLGSTLASAGLAWSEAAGGTSGALWGGMLAAAGTALGDTDAPDATALASAVAAAVDSLSDLGGAAPGDKTMVDAARPFADALAAALGEGQGADEAFARACTAARAGALATARMVASLGRARTHGARSIGTPDPGALSFALVVEAAAKALGIELDPQPEHHTATTTLEGSSR